MAKKHREEEHEEHIDESWLVPYADVLTLLLALFIVLFASSKVEKTKLQQMSDSFRSIFGGGAGFLSGGAGAVPVESLKKDKEAPIENPQDMKNKEMLKLQSIKDKIDKLIAGESLQSQMSTRWEDDGLVIEIKNRLIFKNNGADLTPYAMSLLSAVSGAMNDVDEDVTVSGYTDNSPANTANFPSNWDLTSKMALNVMRYMISQNSLLNPQHFTAIGYGEYKPLVPNVSPENMAQNNRIEIKITKSYK